MKKLFLTLAGLLFASSAVAGFVTHRGGTFSAYIPQSLTYFAQVNAAGQSLTTAQKINIDTLVRSLVYSGVYSELDALYLLNAPTAAIGKINVIGSTFNGGSATLTVAGAGPTCVANTGCTSASTSNYYSSNFDPTVTTPVQPQFTGANSTMFFFVPTVNGVSGTTSYGGIASNTRIANNPTGPNIYAQSNGVGGYSGNVTFTGGLTTYAQNAGNIRYYTNGKYLGTAAGTNTLNSGNAALLRASGLGAGVDVLGAAGWGAIPATNEQDDVVNLTWALTNYNNACCSSVPAVAPNYISTFAPITSNTLNHPQLAASITRLADGRLYVIWNQKTGGTPNGVINQISSSSNGASGSWDTSTLGTGTVGGGFSSIDVNVFYVSTLPDGSLLGIGDYTPSVNNQVAFTARATVTPNGAVTWGSLTPIVGGPCGASLGTCKPNGPITILQNGTCVASAYDGSFNIYLFTAPGGCLSGTISWTVTTVVQAAQNTQNGGAAWTDVSVQNSNPGTACPNTGGNSGYDQWSEPAMTQLPNGNVVLIIRNSPSNGGNYCRLGTGNYDGTGLYEVDFDANLNVTSGTFGGYATPYKIVAQQLPGNPSITASPSGTLVVFGRFDGPIGYVFSTSGGGAGGWTTVSGLLVPPNQLLNYKWGSAAAPDFAYGQVIWDSVSGGALFATMLGDEPQGVESSLHWGGNFMSLTMP